MLEIKRIVVGTDLSDASLAALERAYELALQTRAELYVVHAFELPSYGALEGAYIPSAAAVSELNAQHATALADQVRGFQDRGVESVHTRLLVGEAAGVLLQVADAADASVIVVSTHGRSGIARALLGSVAERLMRESKRPVLVVPARKR